MFVSNRNWFLNKKTNRLSSSGSPIIKLPFSELSQLQEIKSNIELMFQKRKRGEKNESTGGSASRDQISKLLRNTILKLPNYKQDMNPKFYSAKDYTLDDILYKLSVAVRKYLFAEINLVHCEKNSSRGGNSSSNSDYVLPSVECKSFFYLYSIYYPLNYYRFNRFL